MDKSEKTQTNSEKMIAISILEKLEKAIKEYDKGDNDWCENCEGNQMSVLDHQIYHAEDCYNIVANLINELKKR